MPFGYSTGINDWQRISLLYEMVRRRPIILLIISCIILSVYYKCCEYRPYFHSPILIELNTFMEINNYTGEEDYLINTTGCFIPNYIKTYKLREVHNQHRSCGERAVFMKRRNDEIIFEIDENVLNRVYNKNNYSYQCCYSIISRSDKAGYEDTKINYSQCKLFEHNNTILHENEAYTVTCTTQPPKGKKKAVIYDDAYLILKKQKTEVKRDNRWNLLVIGIDTNSRARLLKSMPKTAEYLQRHGWLDFRGLQKIGYNTLPNLGALLMGQKIDTIRKQCAEGMHTCNHLMIWSRFREAGYKTAYCEDNLSLPDTFYSLNGFKIVPTDHYTRSFYLVKEKQMGNLICTKKLPSSEHMLNYAYDFVESYKQNNFFGVFWINTISHNLNYLPTLHDDNMVKFFERINSTGALRNTFIMFVSDHGIRFGDSRRPIEAYYDERLPMLYIWTPISFRQQYPLEYYNLQVNQNRLITPYDLHLTFQNILDLTNQSNTSNTTLACKSCKSLFQEISENRVCADVEVSEKWCSCQTLVPIDKDDPAANISVQLAASYIHNKAVQTETKGCKQCKTLQLDTVLRTHTYEEGDRNIYVVAFKMKPIDMDYEATVVSKNGSYDVLDTIYSMTAFNRKGDCVKHPYDRAYCLCETNDTCTKG